MEEKILAIIRDAIDRGILRRIVLSGPSDPQNKRMTVELFAKKGEVMAQFSTFRQDGKAIHRNLPVSDAPNEAVKAFLEGYRQLDVNTSAGQCTVLSNGHGKLHVKNLIVPASTLPENTGEPAVEPMVPEIRSHDREKQYLLDGSEPFLRMLGISDGGGTVIDRKRPKFRQINRFLEILRDLLPEIPHDPEKPYVVCDLCCGKSYLTFAVYHYMVEVLGKSVRMYGVDRKSDVIDYCAAAAEKLGYDGLSFECGDIADFETLDAPDLVISLHACDTTTDIVLAYAVKNHAKAILSTPCCHHEMSSQLDSPALSYITRYPILRQKFCDIV